MTLPSNEAVLSAVQAGDGVAALSEHVAGAALAAGWVVAIRFDLPARSFRMLCHRDRTRAAGAFVAALATAFPDRPGASPISSPPHATDKDAGGKQGHRLTWWCPPPDSNRHARGPRILSPLRLPFRQAGTRGAASSYRIGQTEKTFNRCATGPDHVA